MNDFQLQVKRRQAASFGGIKIVTRDEHVCQKQLRAALKGDVLVWSAASGLWGLEDDGKLMPVDPEKTDAFEFGLQLKDYLRDRSEQTQTSIIALGYDHWLNEDPVLRRHMFETVKDSRATGNLVLLVSRHEELHPELHDEIGIIRHPLPDREAAQDELERLLSRNEVRVNGQLDLALDAVQGLTSSRQADAFSLAIVDALMDKRELIDVDVLRRYKEEEIGRLDYLKVSEPSKSFDDLKGHNYLKTWLRNRRLGFLPEAVEAAVPTPRGVMFVGPPGTGKSRLVEACASEWRVPFLTLDVGSVFSKYVGESEAQITNAIEIAERMSPCVLLIDEVERAVGGEGGNSNDGGTTDRVIGKLLTWMANKTAPVFVVFTSNKADQLPAALIRKGRLDEIFFVDFPTATERTDVFNYYLGKAPTEVKDTDLAKLVKATDQWSGAEIEAAVGDARFTAFADNKRLVTTQDVMQEISRTTPVSKSMADQISRMRKWAESYARNTDEETGNKPYSGSSRRISVDA
jgi:AAA+ superfamily predicted ATPase